MSCSACLPIQSRATAEGASLPRALIDRVVGFFTSGDWSTGRVRTRRAVAELSARQLADVGIDRASVCRARPVIEIKGGLIANLSSLR